VPFSLKILRPARKKLDNLARKIYVHIENLEEDPYVLTIEWT
jgi:hypothetical protein